MDDPTAMKILAALSGLNEFKKDHVRLKEEMVGGEDWGGDLEAHNAHVHEILKQRFFKEIQTPKLRKEEKQKCVLTFEPHH